MRGAVRSFFRLLIFQASWTYERLQGIGMGYTSAPLLEPLKDDPERYRAAVARSAEYFNANPYLAGIAVGAAAKGELEGSPGATVRRLRTALCGPLGSLGDQLFWIGVVPALTGAALALLAVKHNAWIVVGLVVVYNAIRLITTWWGLMVGLGSGLAVGAALAKSGLRATATRIGCAAGFAVGFALPLVAQWYAHPLGPPVLMAGVAGGGLGTLAALVQRRVFSAATVTPVVLAAALLLRWGFG
ncbi:MAG: PTS system mannose/fructose/sorbose family transporter subunit IID [Gemmatimonadota bacterium]